MNKQDIFIGIGIVIIAALFLILKFGFGDSLNPPSQCGVVVNTEFSSIQYVGQNSFGVVRVGSGYKSFSTQDYVVIGDTLCKRDAWKKEDGYIKNPLSWKQ